MEYVLCMKFNQMRYGARLVRQGAVFRTECGLRRIWYGKRRFFVRNAVRSAVGTAGGGFSYQMCFAVRGAVGCNMQYTNGSLSEKLIPLLNFH